MVTYAGRIWRTFFEAINMNQRLTRRRFLADSRAVIFNAGLLAGAVSCGKGSARADDTSKQTSASDHKVTVISGKPRDRGRQYGVGFSQAIGDFLERETFVPYAKGDRTRRQMLRYAAACVKPLRAFSPEIVEELEGVAEGAGRTFEEVMLLTLHEEYVHGGHVVPTGHQTRQHCTAFAVGPPTTANGDTYVGQTWDWTASTKGLSSLLLWKRLQGPDVLAYTYPGLLFGTGMNSAGIALTWTSVWGKSRSGARVGIPTYPLIAQMLYQETLEGAIAEARRAKNAGWFTFLLADAKGRLANVEGSPRGIEIEYAHGHIARANLGTRKITETPVGQPVELHPRCKRMNELIVAEGNQLTLEEMQRFFDDPSLGIAKPLDWDMHTHDAMLYNTTRRELFISRSPVETRHWTRIKMTG